MVSEMAKNPAMQETWLPSLGREDPLEKRMATHSSILAWRIPWTEELVGFSPQGCKESDTADHILLTIQMHVHNITAWRRQWQPTPVFLPAESQGRGSLVGCRLWGRTESDMTEAT